MPAQGRILKTTTPDRFDRNIKTQWMQGYGEPEHEFEKIYEVMTSQVQDERFSYVTPLGRWQQKDYGSNVVFDNIHQGYDTTCTPATYKNGFTIEEEDAEDDPQGSLASDLAASLGHGGRDTLEYLAAVPFNNSTATTYASPWQSGGDGAALLSTAHLVPAGGYYANCPSSHVDLSVASLQAARTRMEKLVNSRGLLWRMEAKTLVVPTDSRWIVAEILGSDKVPYTADNTPNVVRQGLTEFVWSRLTDTDSWFLLAAKATSKSAKGHMAKCVMRIRPEFGRNNEFLSGDRQYKGRMRVGFVFPDARGIDGSTGG